MEALCTLNSPPVVSFTTSGGSCIPVLVASQALQKLRGQLGDSRLVKLEVGNVSEHTSK